MGLALKATALLLACVLFVHTSTGKITLKEDDIWTDIEAKSCDVLGSYRYARDACGKPLTGEMECLALGCCFDDTYSDVPKCYRPVIDSGYYMEDLDTLAGLQRVDLRSGIVIPPKKFGDCECGGRESGSGSGPRRFEVKCVKSGATKSCTYKGNPHNCREYNQGNQIKFYDQMLTAIGDTQCRGMPNCPVGQVFYTKRVCSDIPFKCEG